ncbi:hypothetical protein Thivi_4130 [Thiocystis violascens DSM 198]|uniref:Uncharacterized protein n=1 Tax=Thiocystis violascens (strain ATCC 17096 / DSM 198 / 6111) TaxID=765911 RepID=I3YG32_THIV6|nr:hypothetical protein Thivi_4130 [Thiocystis violascens DSM 198]
MTYVYEEPSSLSVSDWEVFRDRMIKEVARYPDREDAAEALRFAEFMLNDIKQNRARRLSEAA